MQRYIFSMIFAVSSLVAGNNLASASEDNTGATRQPVSIATETEAKTQAQPTVTKHHSDKKAKLVDLNSAKKEELMKLPGIGEVEADKIIATRPIGSKAWLVSHKIISMASYQLLNKRVYCKLNKKDIDKIMSQHAHEHKK